MADRGRTGLILRLYLAASPLIAPLARRHLDGRLERGKEDPQRFREKLGEASQSRPEGLLIWFHAVGVGEVLALPGLIMAVRALRPDVTALVTSSSRTSAEALAPNLPPGTIHQFLPLDSLPFVQRFLEHWRPDLAIWAERDIWPALVIECERRRIPQALVNARMSDASYRSKARFRGLFGDLYRRMAWIGVQDARTAGHFQALGVQAVVIMIDGSLKAGSAPLGDYPQARAVLVDRMKGRCVWLAASTHPGDEPAVIAAHTALLQNDPTACLIIAPRDPQRATDVSVALSSAGISNAVTADMTLPGNLAAYVISRIGQMGLWYRLANTAFVGGSIADVGGHNPYEPARLGCAILHGPHIYNFADDYAAFHTAGAARLVQGPGDMAAALCDPALEAQCAAAAVVAGRGSADLHIVAARIVSLMPAGVAS